MPLTGIKNSYSSNLQDMSGRSTTDMRKAQIKEVYTVEESGCQEALVWMDGDQSDEAIVVRIPSSIRIENGDRGTTGEWVWIRKPGLRGGSDLIAGRAPKGKWVLETASETGGGTGSGTASHWIPYTINDLENDEPAPLYMPSDGEIVWAYAGCRLAATDQIQAVVKISGDVLLTVSIGANKKRGARVQATGGDFAAGDHIKVAVTNAADAGAPMVVVIGYNLGVEPAVDEED